LLAPQQAEGFAMGPARAFSLAREARRQFRSKKVRISSNKRTKTRHSDFLEAISWAAHSAAEFRISLCEMRRQRVLPLFHLPIRRQR